MKKLHIKEQFIVLSDTSFRNATFFQLINNLHATWVYT